MEAQLSQDRPLAVDLCCGLGGWTEGLHAEGYTARGYDIEAHQYDGERYPGELVLQSILDLDGADCADADLIVASPPCTEYSYMAMPWSRAKQIAAALRGLADFPEGYKGSRTIADLNALFDACFRIQREASAAAGRHIPMVLENVKGAQPWVGRARWAFGSYFLWGDVPALMPIQKYHSRLKVKAGEQWNINRENFTGTRGWDEGVKNGEAGGGSWFAIGSPGQAVTGGNPDGRKNPGFRFDGSGKSFQTESVNRHVAEGLKHRDADGYERDHPQAFGWKSPRTSSSAVSARKAASARIAKIPLPLSQHIARAWKP